MKFFGAASELRQPRLVIFVCLAWLISGLGLWLVTRSALALVTYLGAITFLGALAYFAYKLSHSAAADEFAMPDWSVTSAAIDRSPLAIVITDRASRLVCANTQYQGSFGLELTPSNLAVNRSELERLSRTARTALRDGSADADNFELFGQSGLWHVHVARAGRGDDFLIWYFERKASTNISDIALDLLAGPIAESMAYSGIELALVGADGIIQKASGGFARRATGDKNATLAGQEFVSYLRSDERDRIYFEREGRAGVPQTLIEIPLISQQTQSHDAQAVSLMMLLEDGVGVGAHSESADIGLLANLQALLGALPLGLALADRDGRFLFGNDAFLRVVGRNGKNRPAFPSDLVVREDKAAFADAVRRHGRGAVTSGDIAVRLQNDPEEPVSVGLAGVRGLGDAGVLISIADTSEAARLKRQIAQATKMQAVGQLAGGVAHDFNNVLTAIIGYCDLMLLRHTPGDSDYDDIQQIRANSNRAASLTRQLLAFSRQQTLRPEILQLPDVVSEVSQLLKRLLGENIEFKVRHDRALGHVRADPQQLEQVIVNLAVNARDAIHAHGRGRGELLMQTRRVSAEDIRAMGSDIIPVADYSVLIVTDNGGGIPQDKLGKIFEPFFTTKEQGKGTGLGLSTVYGIVKQSGGFIFADNVVGANEVTVGARFTIYLPVYTGAIPAASKPQIADTADTQWAGGGRVLLVEDEDMVRVVAMRALTRAGFEVIEAADGEAGLAQIQGDEKFDIIVSDVVMPGMDGPAMVKQIRAQNAQIPVLFMSGYAEEHLRREIDTPNLYFIAKPFSVQQIVDKVETVLAAQNTGKKLS